MEQVDGVGACELCLRGGLKKKLLVQRMSECTLQQPLSMILVSLHGTSVSASFSTPTMFSCLSSSSRSSCHDTSLIQQTSISEIICLSVGSLWVVYISSHLFVFLLSLWRLCVLDGRFDCCWLSLKPLDQFHNPQTASAFPLCSFIMSSFEHLDLLKLH